ncbi:hypothetical protein D0Y65_000950 [Glycine soja]|uniref:DUF4283 domain-containing protein n=2 Tax=Glycine subgen. Soja TaxID=1462606 RepID=A0A0R0L8Y3_SOYBN|nr:hypothetical protein D0Y65_000950 [Glycine soja]
MGNGGSSKEPPNSGGGGKRRVSFKDLMIGNKAPVALRQKTMVHILDSVFEGLCVAWQDALMVVKILGKNFGFNVMKDKLSRIWKLVAGFDMLDIGNNFYMVKFDTEADKVKVMTEDPWMIFDHYVTVQT